MAYTNPTPADNDSSSTPASGKTVNYLALGDSYTIGQSVSEADRFPNQTAALLRNRGINMKKPDIIAVTGWTTYNLENGIQSWQGDTTYDVVTLLIGVNDQYQGYSVEDYKPQFEKLLKEAIHFAKDSPSHVFVLSIPDYSVTPFASGRDTAKIASDINAFNAANKAISDNYHVHYLNITPDTRKAADDPSLIASDGLHPSGKEYGVWAQKLATQMEAVLK